MEFVLNDLVRGYLGEVLGVAASGATLLTFAQKRMWPMRISAIAANLFFIGYGALGLLYPVLFLHLVLLPLNVARLVQLAQQSLQPPTPERQPGQPILLPQALVRTRSTGPGGSDELMHPGRFGTASALWDTVRHTPP